MANSLEMEKSDYYEKEAALSTNKVKLMDIGSGLAIASTTILLFLNFRKIKTFRDFENVMTFSKSYTFTSANIAWLALIPGTVWYYVFRAGRADYPPFTDSIGEPIMSQIPFLLVLLVPLNMFILLTSINANLPTELFVKPSKYSSGTIFWEVFFGFWLLINMIFLVSFVRDGDHISIPVNLYFTFILLSLRAGQICKYKHRPITKFYPLSQS